MVRRWGEEDAPHPRPSWLRLTLLAVAAALAIAAAIAGARGQGYELDGPHPTAAAPAVTDSTSPYGAEDPGITACREVAERMDRVKAGGAAPTDAERARARRLLQRSLLPDLRAVGQLLERTKDASLYDQAEASGRLVAACTTAGYTAGLVD